MKTECSLGKNIHETRRASGRERDKGNNYLRSKKNKNIFEIRMLKIATLITAKAARFFPLKRNSTCILRIGQQNIKDRYLIHSKFATKKMAEAKLYTNKEDTVAYLKSIGLAFNLIEHEPCFTVEDMAKHIKLEKAPLIKNLFYSDKKNNYYLVVARSDTKVEKTLWK